MGKSKPLDTAESFEIEAARAYAVYRGGADDLSIILHWNDLNDEQREAFTAVYFLGRLDEHLEQTIER